MAMYIAYNSAFGLATPASMLGISYTAGLRVAVQLATPSTLQIRVVEWGVSFGGTASGAPATCELIQAGATTAGTMTAHSTTTVQPIGDGTKSSGLTMGATATSYSSSAANGTGTAAVPEKYFDAQLVGPTSQYLKQWPLGREPIVAASKFCQLRVNAAATLQTIAYIVFEEC